MFKPGRGTDRVGYPQSKGSGDKKLSSHEMTHKGRGGRHKRKGGR